MTVNTKACPECGKPNVRVRADGHTLYRHGPRDTPCVDIQLPAPPPPPAPRHDCGHIMGQPGCELATCLGVPPVSVATCDRYTPSEYPTPGEAGQAALGRAIVAAYRRLTGVTIDMPTHTASRGWDNRHIRRMGVWRLTAAGHQVHVVGHETRHQLSRSLLWYEQVIIEGKPVDELIPAAQPAEALGYAIAYQIALHIGAVDQFGLPPMRFTTTSTDTTSAESEATMPETDTVPPAEPTDEPTAVGRLTLTVPRQALDAALRFVAPAAPTRPRVPVLTGVRVTAGPDGARVATFDYEQARTAPLVGAAVATAGVLLVSCHNLAKIVDKAPGDTVTLTDLGTRCRLTVGSARFYLPTMPVEDHPDLPDMQPTVGTVGLRELAGVVAKVAKSACTEPTLPILNGVHVTADGGRLRLAATDRYRVGIGGVAWQPAGVLLPTTVPATILAQGVAALGKAVGDGSVTIGLGTEQRDQAERGVKDAPIVTVTVPNMISLSVGGFTLTTLVIDSDVDGKGFPKVERVLPGAGAFVGTVDAAALAKAVATVGIVANKSVPARITFAGDGTALVATGGIHDDSYDDGACDTVPADWNGPAGTRYAFNRAYLIEGLTTIGGRVEILGTDPIKPTLLRSTADPDGYQFGLMPIRLTDAPTDLDIPQPEAADTDPDPSEHTEPEPEEPMNDNTARTAAQIATEAFTAMRDSAYVTALMLIDEGEMVDPEYRIEDKFAWAQARELIAKLREQRGDAAPAGPEPDDEPDTDTDDDPGTEPAPTPVAVVSDATHTCNPKRPGFALPFGRKAEPGACVRCDQLRAGAPTKQRPGRPDTPAAPAPVVPTAPTLSMADAEILYRAKEAALAAVTAVAEPAPAVAPSSGGAKAEYGHTPGLGRKAQRREVRRALYAASRGDDHAALRGVVCTVEGDGAQFTVSLRTVPEGADRGAVWEAVDLVVTSVLVLADNA